MKKGILLILGLLIGLPAMAGVTVNVQSVTLTGSTTTTTNGFFDVFIGVTGTGNGSMASWQTQVFLATGAGEPTGLTLGTPTVTDVLPTIRPMALGTDSGWVNHNGADTDTATQASSTQSVGTAVPLDGDNGGGFMRVPFTVAANTTGTFHITLDPSDVTGTALFDDQFNEIPYTAVNGTVTVSVPEPASLGLLALGGAALLARRRRLA